MFNYLEKFKKLPKELQAIVSSSQATNVFNELEKKYGIELASLAIKVMVKEVSWINLENVLVNDYHITKEQAVQLKQEMKQKIFYQVTRYLNINLQGTSNKLQTTTDDEKLEIEETKETAKEKVEEQGNALFPQENKNKLKIANDISQGDKELEKVVAQSAEAIDINNQELGRLKSIIRTFKKGIRDDLDTIDTLKKSKDSGGLSLNQEQAEQVIEIINGEKISENKKIPLRHPLRQGYGGQEGYEGQVKKSVSNFSSVEQIRDVEYDLSALEKKSKRVESQKVHLPADITALQAGKVESTTTDDEQLEITKLETEKLETMETTDDGDDSRKIEDKMPIPEFTEEELEHELAPPPPTIIQNSMKDKKLETTETERRGNASPLRETTKEKLKEQSNVLLPQKDKKKELVISPEKLKQAEKKIEEKQEIEEQSSALSRQEEKQQLKVNVQRPTIVSSENKPQVNDITKPRKRLEGPIEELANLDLVNFRRLSDNPKTAMKKIKQKIDLLEEESFTKRHQGINAWRHSQVYQVYITLGQESIKQGISVKDVIKKREVSDEEVLTIEEFNAIMDLNKTLRF